MTKVLIVDDNQANLKLVAYVVEAAGFEVATALDAEKALATLATTRPDVILMDLQLPGIDGLELTRRIKADPATRGIAVIAVTAYAMKAIARRPSRRAAMITSPSRSTPARSQR